MLRALPLLPGDLGTYQTLGVMRAMVRRDYVLPQVRLLAQRIAAPAGAKDGEEQARAIRDFLEDHTQFLRDPYQGEMLHAPLWQVRAILTRDCAYVDCDDVAMLAAALGMSIGLQARFVVVAFGSPQAPFRHVWTELASPTAPQRWYEMDVTRPSQGLPLDRISRTYRVGV